MRYDDYDGYGTCVDPEAGAIIVAIFWCASVLIFYVGKWLLIVIFKLIKRIILEIKERKMERESEF